jgi:hypothetical protein
VLLLGVSIPIGQNGAMSDAEPHETRQVAAAASYVIVHDAMPRAPVHVNVQPDPHVESRDGPGFDSSGGQNGAITLGEGQSTLQTPSRALKKRTQDAVPRTPVHWY